MKASESYLVVQKKKQATLSFSVHRVQACCYQIILGQLEWPNPFSHLYPPTYMAIQVQLTYYLSCITHSFGIICLNLDKEGGSFMKALSCRHIYQHISKVRRLFDGKLHQVPIQALEISQRQSTADSERLSVFSLTLIQILLLFSHRRQFLHN
jgi:hypothetical protein